MERRHLNSLTPLSDGACPAIIRRRAVVFSVLLLLLFSVSGCVSQGGGAYHTVKKGETLWRISKHYGVDVKDVAEANNIRKPGDLEAGRRIIIPGAKKHNRAHPKHNNAPAPVERFAVANPQDEKNRRVFSWPVRGEVSSSFGTRSGARHDGIDIRAAEGTPVQAADDGRVIYISETMRGYGNIIILSHSENYYTVYAHNKQNLVKNGDKVAKGDVIATVGSTGNASGNHLHFEVRKGKVTLNPIFYLPKS